MGWCEDRPSCTVGQADTISENKWARNRTGLRPITLILCTFAYIRKARSDRGLSYPAWNRDAKSSDLTSWREVWSQPAIRVKYPWRVKSREDVMEMGIYSVHLHQPDFAEELSIHPSQQVLHMKIEIGFA